MIDDSSSDDFTEILNEFKNSASAMNSNSVAKKLVFNETFQLNDLIFQGRSTSNKRKSFARDDTPHPAEKKLKEDVKTNVKDDSIVVQSPWETRRIRADLLEARSHIIQLENNIKKQHTLRKQMEILFDDEKKTLLRQKETDARTISELEQRLKCVRKREQETKQELIQSRYERDQLKLNTDSVIHSLQTTIGELEERIQEMSSEHDDSFERDKRDCELMTASLNNIQSENEEVIRVNEELTAEITELRQAQRQNEITTAELQAAHIKICELESMMVEYGDWQNQAKASQRRLAMMPDLEREADRLREEVRSLHDLIRNKLILEEQVHDLRARLEQATTQVQATANIQMEFAQADEQLKEWKDLGRDLCKGESHTPRDLRRYIEELQQNELILTDEKIKAQSIAKSSTFELTTVKQQLEKYTTECTALSESVKRHEGVLHRVQRKLYFVARERDSYRTLLDSYEKDLTIHNPANMSSPEVQLQQRLESMDKVLEGYKELNAKYEMDLQAAQQSTQPDNSNVAPIRMEQITRLQNENANLLRENEKLMKRRDELETMLEYRSLKGDFNVKTDKIVHFTNNPLAESQDKYVDDVTKLQAEVNRLKKKLKQLEEGNQEITQDVSVTATQELLSLREQVKANDFKMQRLKEVFKSSSLEFRNVCYMMLGYKIDRVSNNHYRITNMYAEDRNEYLNFQVTDEGSLNLLETPYSLTLDEMINLHLRNQGSVPVFLSALTLDLFKRTTIMAT